MGLVLKQRSKLKELVAPAKLLSAHIFLVLSFLFIPTEQLSLVVLFHP